MTESYGQKRAAQAFTFRNVVPVANAREKKKAIVQMHGALTMLAASYKPGDTN